MTSNFVKRLIAHQSQKYPDCYTAAARLPVELAFYSEFTNINFAIAKEKQIKKWSRAKKEALISGNFQDLPKLSKKKFTK